ncbi:Cyclin-like F-box [Ophiocordyceps sinensis CO18]|uniref:Cyclin-like F-box n=1 Tax=Ophiocordyceps sinensis (strain Co18 / CGMCC 3.14243) TaxID=911162 RepID=T5A908_OPHSC|nr:Cyclin-like F-box [Ophiocordyceps sinensis CO18]
MAALVPRGYRSATEYRFQEDQTDAIVRAAAYHRKDYCRSVIWFSPREHVGIRPSIATPFPRNFNTGLGSLDRLPLELLHDVLLRLDMQSLFNFRQTNLRSRQMVHSLKQYQMVALHGLNLLCALLRTRLAIGVSLFDFYHALCTKICTFCGEFGGFISLLTWNRCCFECLQRAQETQVQTLAAMRKQFHLTKAEIRQLMSFKTLAGIYSMKESPYKSRITVVSVHQAMSVTGQQPRARAQAQPAKRGRNQTLNFMGACALPYYDGRTGKVEDGMSCAGCQLALEKDIIGSRGEKWAFEARDKVYAQDGFLEHFPWCEQAQLLWRSSGQGNHQPTELPEAARRGGFFNERE